MAFFCFFSLLVGVRAFLAAIYVNLKRRIAFMSFLGGLLPQLVPVASNIACWSSCRTVVQKRLS
jgi:hypothetical protein